jgi:nitrite reductase/ring-hydroxylating ferredoxin subunit
MGRRKLCDVDEMRNGDAKAFETPGDDVPNIFVIRKGDDFHGYLNDCPHWNISLDFVPGKFMTLDKRFVQCSNHGARFDINTGKCLFGPCRGQSLTVVPIVVEDGALWLDDYDLRLADRGEWRLTPRPD